jgi:hypothetical protein
MIGARLSLLLVLALAASTLVGVGCGDDDDSSDEPAASTQPCQTGPAGDQTGTSAAAAKQAAIAYFLSCDPESCTEDVTEHHVRVDYGGDLARCEEVRRNNQIASDDVRTPGRAKVTGDTATVEGRVLVTGEAFVIKLKNVDGSWKVDRIRGSQ